jgi:hypothetical protein
MECEIIKKEEIRRKVAIIVKRRYRFGSIDKAEKKLDTNTRERFDERRRKSSTPIMLFQPFAEQKT